MKKQRHKMLMKFRNDSSVSLFPFLDALSGVIGVLTLIIAVMAIIGLQTSRVITSQWTSQDGLKPVFVECFSDGIRIHPEELTIDAGDVSGSNKWKTLVDRIKDSNSEYVVFLIRPSGIDTFWEAKNAFPASLRHGYDIVNADDKLDF
ncbi:MAG: hypothetical protein R3C03_03980 [Pirellulaceae bacterium]